MRPEHDRGRPRQESAPTTVTTVTKEYTAGSDNHGALIADAAHAYLDVFFWEQAIRELAKTGREFCADDAQGTYSLPDLGNATGGIFMRLHRAGVIRRVGYRPSSRPSRAGGVVAIWAAGDPR
jgi:hypothetical protein